MDGLVTLTSGRMAATVDPMGGWLCNLTVDGEPIFYEKQTIIAASAQKQRGGCHVCFPNFGPGGPSRLPQHGYGRERLWQVVEQSEQAVRLHLPGGKEKFELLTADLEYSIKDNSLAIELSVTNPSSESWPLAPGLHPYFATGEATSVTVNECQYELAHLDPVQFLEGESMLLHVGRATYLLTSRELPTWGLWSDRLGTYVCLEPTASGFSYEDDRAARIQPGQVYTYSLSLRAVDTT